MSWMSLNKSKPLQRRLQIYTIRYPLNLLLQNMRLLNDADDAVSLCNKPTCKRLQLTSLSNALPHIFSSFTANPNRTSLPVLLQTPAQPCGVSSSAKCNLRRFNLPRHLFHRVWRHLLGSVQLYSIRCMWRHSLDNAWRHSLRSGAFVKQKHRRGIGPTGLHGQGIVTLRGLDVARLPSDVT